MSMATRAKSARARATIAANMIKKQKTFGRAFDDCFEMNDGDEVMNWIIKKARTDWKLAAALRDKFPNLGHGDFNTRMHEAIKACLDEELLKDLTQYSEKKLRNYGYDINDYKIVMVPVNRDTMNGGFYEVEDEHILVPTNIADKIASVTVNFTMTSICFLDAEGKELLSTVSEGYKI